MFRHSKWIVIAEVIKKFHMAGRKKPISLQNLNQRKKSSHSTVIEFYHNDKYIIKEN